jgi:hypothetical protein
MASLASFLSGLYPWFAGITGGLLANITANIIWRKYTKPNLIFDDTTRTDFEVDTTGSPEARRFKILVKNKGKTAAKNCKAQIRLVGKHESSLYKIERTVRWAEENHPSRITINPGESAAFEYFKVSSEKKEVGVLKSKTEFFVQFPESHADDRTKDIVEWQYENDDFSKVKDADFHGKISKELFEKLEWKSNEIIVTSENTDKIEGLIVLQSDIEDTEGLVGLNAQVIPK